MCQNSLKGEVRGTKKVLQCASIVVNELIWVKVTTQTHRLIKGGGGAN